MKDLFVQKAKLNPSCPADSSEASAKSPKASQSVVASQEGQRKVRQSAAMIGLAISMGASGLLFPNQKERAIAAEPITAKSALTDLATKTEATDESSQPQVTVQPVTPVAELPAIQPETELQDDQKLAAPTLKHEVKEGETLWELSQNYEVAPEAIAASNKLESKSNLTVGQTLKIPAVKTQQLQPVEPIAATPTESNLDENAVNVSSDVDQLLRNRQETALNNLQKQRKDLVDSLTELRSEESNPNPSRLENQPEEKPLSIASSNSGTVLETETKSNSPNPIQELEQQTAAAPFASNEETADLNAPIPIPVPAPATSTPNQIRQEQPITIPVPIPGNTNLNPSRTEAVTPSQNLTPSLNPQPLPSTATKPTEEKVGLSNFTEPIPIPVPTPETAKNNQNTDLDRVVSLPSPGAESVANPRTQTLARLDLSQPNPVSPASSPTHQVRRGDTLDSIARRYGISRSELARANRITNPNLIKVNQQLVIPGKSVATNSSQPLTLIPGLSVSSNNGNNQQNRRSPDLLQGQRQEINEVAAAPANGGLSNFNAPITIPVDVNPEWQNERLSRPNGVNVKPAASNPVTQTRVQRVSRNNDSQLMAVAPVESQSYNGMLQVPVGETVSPELPPLSSPDQYLPGSQQRFNGYIWPAKGVLTSGYGRRWGRMHRGIDIAGPVGTPIVAAAPGEVISAGWNSGGYGNLVKVKHSDGSVTLYAHNSRILVRRGQYVDQGERIAEMGSTGRSTGPHLHFEVHPTGQGAVNPIAFLPRR